LSLPLLSLSLLLSLVVVAVANLVVAAAAAAAANADLADCAAPGGAGRLTPLRDAMRAAALSSIAVVAVAVAAATAVGVVDAVVALRWGLACWRSSFQERAVTP
jgi:hypothetical protein